MIYACSEVFSSSLFNARRDLSFFFKRKTAYELRISDWSSDVCSSDLARTVVARDGSPARIVAPDPRWFALHKLWMSAQAKRNPLKRPKDAKQGTALLDAVAEAMPQFPLDAAFAAELPDELAPHYAAWESRRPEAEIGRAHV